MDRRELLKALPALIGAPVLYQGKEVGKAFEVQPNSKYIIFLNVFSGVSVDSFCAPEHPVFPTGTPVYMVGSGDMDNVIRIFKVDD